MGCTSSSSSSSSSRRPKTGVIENGNLGAESRIDAAVVVDDGDGLKEMESNGAVLSGDGTGVDGEAWRESGVEGTMEGEKEGKREKKRGGSAGKDTIPVFAALLIQRWYRKTLAELELRRRLTWRIFQDIEYSGEQDHIKLQKFFTDAIFNATSRPDLTQGNFEGEKTWNSDKNDESLTRDCEDSELSLPPEIRDKDSIQEIHVEKNYKGPKFEGRLDHGAVMEMADFMRTNSKSIVHFKYVVKIFVAGIEIMKTKPNVNEISTTASQRVTVCGDIHGQSADLLTIFNKNGLPCADNPYVFNGDFVDRGRHSIEVLLLLLLCSIAYPTHFHLNRGNHEDYVLNMRYGFTREIMKKYGKKSSLVLQLVKLLFRWLPLVSVVDNKILIAHGGLTPEFSLRFVSSIHRFKMATLCRPPTDMQGRPDLLSRALGLSQEGSLAELRTEPMTSQMRDFLEWQEVVDILWSDPRTKDGTERNDVRGGGCVFGPDVTKRILEKNNLRLLIRSHECKEEGFEYTHDGMVLTVFSASNYYALGSNRGAYVKLQGPDLVPQIVQFSATKVNKLRSTQQTSIVESSALQHLRSTLASRRHLLLREFRRRDILGSGVLSLEDWAKSLEEVVPTLKIPWRRLQPKLSLTDENGKVRYESCFEVLNLDGDTLSAKKGLQDSPQSLGSPPVAELIYRHRPALETVFRIMDRDSSGTVTKEEFKIACKLLFTPGTGPFASEASPFATTRDSDSTLDDLASTIDINKDGVIDFNEFLEAFRISSEVV